MHKVITGIVRNVKVTPSLPAGRTKVGPRAPHPLSGKECLGDNNSETYICTYSSELYTPYETIFPADPATRDLFGACIEKNLWIYHT